MVLKKPSITNWQVPGSDYFFREVITSESSNSLKPQKEIFEYALQKTGALKEESIMLGDNVEADIIGAMNVGMDQVYIDHLHIPPTVRPTYIVHSLKELEDIHRAGRIVDRPSRGGHLVIRPRQRVAPGCPPDRLRGEFVREDHGGQRVVIILHVDDRRRDRRCRIVLPAVDPEMRVLKTRAGHDL